MNSLITLMLQIKPVYLSLPDFHDLHLQTSPHLLKIYFILIHLFMQMLYKNLEYFIVFSMFQFKI